MFLYYFMCLSLLMKYIFPGKVLHCFWVGNKTVQVFEEREKERKEVRQHLHYILGMGMAFGLSSSLWYEGGISKLLTAPSVGQKFKADQGFSRHLESETYCSIYVFMWAAESQSGMNSDGETHRPQVSNNSLWTRNHYFYIY